MTALPSAKSIVSSKSASCFTALFLAFCAAMPCVDAARADTLLWYRFDGEGATIENKANPGVMDGTLKGIKTWGSSPAFDDDTTKYPTRTELPDGWAKTIDPGTDIVRDSAKGLSFPGTGKVGVVYVARENLTPRFKAMTNFTYEAFFKIPSEAIGRSNAMYPIFHWGSDQSEGVMLALYCSSGKFYPYLRYVRKKADGTASVRWGNTTSPTLSISPDEWHHIAFAFACNADTGAYSDRLYVDYNLIEKNESTGCYGIFYNSETNPFILGAVQFNSGRAFWGEIAEVRVSDEFLDVKDFLRPVPSGPVDADTLVYLPLGDTSWFATKTLTKDIWNVPLNGAPTAAWSPTGWATSSVDANLSCGVPALADEAHGSVVRGGCLDTNALADVKSYTFSWEDAVAEGTSGKIGHILQFPKGGLAELYAGDFTFEWFFKTDYQSNQAMLVNPWTKVMINGGKIHPRVGDYNNGGGTGSAVVNDGKWHHCALVYRHSVNTFECWVDYKLDYNPRIADPLATNTQGFYFGGQGVNSQVFNGQLDDLRITKRALAPHEFLTTIPVTADASTTDILHAALEGSLASGQDEFFVSNGVVRVAGTNAKTTAAYADIQRDIDYDNDGEVDKASNKALILTGSNYLDFMSPATWYMRDFTLEFFAKITGEGNDAQLVRLAPSSSPGNPSRWTLSPTGTISIYCSTNGAYHSPESKTAAADPALSITDGQWHHWAVTVATDYSSTTTTVKAYRDYVEVAGGTFTDSVIYFGTVNHSLLFGYSGNVNGGMQAQFDEIRFRPGVQPVSSFMRRVPKTGFMLLVR